VSANHVSLADGFAIGAATLWLDRVFEKLEPISKLLTAVDPI
jgi:hypothetical protein